MVLGPDKDQVWGECDRGSLSCLAACALLVA